MIPVYTSFVKTKLKNLLRNEGNFLNNKQTLKDRKGFFVVGRVSSDDYKVSVKTCDPKVFD